MIWCGHDIDGTDAALHPLLNANVQSPSRSTAPGAQPPPRLQPQQLHRSMSSFELGRRHLQPGQGPVQISGSGMPQQRRPEVAIDPMLMTGHLPSSATLGQASRMFGQQEFGTRYDPVVDARHAPTAVASGSSSRMMDWRHGGGQAMGFASGGQAGFQNRPVEQAGMVVDPMLLPARTQEMGRMMAFAPQGPTLPPAGLRHPPSRSAASLPATPAPVPIFPRSQTAFVAHPHNPYFAQGQASAPHPGSTASSPLNYQYYDQYYDQPPPPLPPPP